MPIGRTVCELAWWWNSWLQSAAKWDTTESGTGDISVYCPRRTRCHHRPDDPGTSHQPLARGSALLRRQHVPAQARSAADHLSLHQAADALPAQHLRAFGALARSLDELPHPQL